MWSASGLLGSRPASQVRRTRQMGQRSSPAARAERLAAAALWSQRVVPVREVVTCPPRARVCARGPRRAAVHVRPASLLPIPFSPEGWQQWSPATVRSGWALTVCLWSYDARFSCSAQAVILSGVSRLGVDGWGGCQWGCPLSVGHPPISGAPSPVYRHPRPVFDGGAPAARGAGVCVGCPLACSPTPPLLWPTPLFVCTPRACIHSVCEHTLEPSERTERNRSWKSPPATTARTTSPAPGTP